MKINHLFIVLLALLLITTTLSARTVIVPSATFFSIQEAIDSLATGDTILVDAPVLSGFGNRDINFNGKGIAVMAFNPSEPVTIDCQADLGNLHRAFIFESQEDSLAVLDGFRIINGYADSGGAIYIRRAAPTLRNITFEDNTGIRGGAIGGDLGRPRITNCTFRNNVASFGGAIEGLGKAVVRDCRFTGNQSLSRGSAVADVALAEFYDCVFDENFGKGATFDVAGGSGRLEQCLFARNQTGAISIVFGEQSLQIDRCTIYGNAFGIHSIGNTFTTPENTIIAYNRGDAVFCSTTDSITARLYYCNVYGNNADYTGCIADNLGQDGNISEPPLFCDTAAFNFTLDASSPCVGAGDGGVTMGAYDVGCTPTDVGEDDLSLPGTVQLAQNYPNPFNPTTTIEFSIPAQAHVSLGVYNTLGRRVAVLLDKTLAAGEYSVAWDGRDHGGESVASGMYFYRLHVDGRTHSRKMLLLK
ncbi:T9SS type A sorting domain-containing protein [candidate division GN15 bacterium]|nr:T9SS type A sorting domain-containing protein [candidate division GN15 bacterium]